VSGQFILPAIVKKYFIKFILPRQKKHMDSYNSPTTKPLYRGTQIVWYILGLIEMLLLFRFVLKLLGANPDAGFSSFVYGVSYIFSAPFLTVFRVVNIDGSIFEWTTLLAMLVYWIIAWGIVKLFLMGKTVSTPEAAAKLNIQDK
jgi:hypothetical protein